MSSIVAIARRSDGATGPGPLDRELIDAREFGGLLGLSDRSVRRKDRAGLIPRPVNLGGSVRWRLAEVRAWISAGCPPRKTWQKMNNL
jgi:predicted DNA-binding transcriptional regulator AlpA